MAESPTSLFELFGSDVDLAAWNEKIKEGKLPTRNELKTILRANHAQPLPEWLLDVVVLGIDGKLKGQRGRPQATSLSKTRWALATAKYDDTLRWLQRRASISGLRGWKAVRDQDWWTGPPHERAARIVIAQLGL